MTDITDQREISIPLFVCLFISFFPFNYTIILSTTGVGNFNNIIQRGTFHCFVRLRVKYSEIRQIESFMSTLK